MPIATSSLEKNIESISKIFTAASKFGVLVGGICVIAYSLRIDHFPQDLSAGDGLLFLMTAACFGFIYMFFTASLVALGISISPGIRAILKLFAWAIGLARKRKVNFAHEFAPFEWIAILLALFSIILIWALGSQDSDAYWNLPLLSATLYLAYSIFWSCGNKIRKIEHIKGSALHTDEKEYVARIGDVEKLRKLQLFSLASILFMPLVFGGVSGQLLDAAMRTAHIRIEKSIIYVKEPYSSLLPKSAEFGLNTSNPSTPPSSPAATSHITPKDYTAFDKTIVLFTGFGKTTVVSFHDAGATKKLEIPNDHIIIENR